MVFSPCQIVVLIIDMLVVFVTQVSGELRCSLNVILCLEPEVPGFANKL